VITASADGPPTQTRDGGVTVHRLRSVRNPAYDTFRIAVCAPWQIAARCAAFEPEAIQLNNPGPSAWALLRWARRRGARVVATHHFLPTTTWRNRPALRPVAGLVERALWLPGRYVHRRADVVTAPSRFALDTLRRRGLRRDGHVVSNGIDTRRFHPGAAQRAVFDRWGVPRAAPVVLHLGRLYPSKRCEVLLAGLRHAPSDAWLVVCGEGPDLPRLRRRAPPRVVFTGRVPATLLPTLYASADVFATASTEELQGIVVLEALASGTPAVAADAAALPELVLPGRTGERFLPGDPRALGAALARVLADRHRRPGHSHYRAACRQTALAHDQARTVDRFEQLLRPCSRYGVGVPSHLSG
jgi:glycosyltransferase involved in cell wall biosynthesis